MRKFGLCLVGVIILLGSRFSADASSIEPKSVMFNSQSIVLTEENSAELGVVFSETKDVTLDSGVVVEVTEEITKVSDFVPHERKVYDTANCVVGSGTYDHSVTIKVPGTFSFELKSTTSYSVSTSSYTVKVVATNTAGTKGIGYNIDTTSSYRNDFAQSDYTVKAILASGSTSYTISKNFSVQGQSGSNLIVKIVTNFYE